MTRVMLVYVLLVLLGKFRELLAMVALRAGAKQYISVANSDKDNCRLEVLEAGRLVRFN